MNKYKILICGYGNIGKHIEKEFQHPNIEIDIFDSYKQEYNIIKDAICYDFIFICVPTEKNLNGSVNIPLYELEQCCERTLKDKEAIIIVYCQYGARSKKAIMLLKRQNKEIKLNENCTY